MKKKEDRAKKLTKRFAGMEMKKERADEGGERSLISTQHAGNP